MIYSSDTNLPSPSSFWSNSTGPSTSLSPYAFNGYWQAPAPAPPRRSEETLRRLAERSPALRRLIKLCIATREAREEFEAALRRRPTVELELRAPLHVPAPRIVPRPATLRPLPLRWPVAIAAYRGRSGALRA